MKQKASEIFWNEININITKWSHPCRGYASIYYVETLNSFNPEIHLKDTEFAIKNKLIDLLFEMRGFINKISNKIIFRV